MPRSTSLRPLAIVLGAALCGALASPALADTPVTVTFQPNSHWAQEVDTVGRDNSSRDYSVAVEAGKTLQINLVTRDPNVFFKIKDETHGKRLVDTYQTGATTWSIQTTGPTTYSIQVYVIPDAMQRGENPKYALQIGQYGPQDLEPATTAMTFQDNSPWAQEASSLNAQAPSHNYTIAIEAGKTMQVNLLTQNPNLHFKVKDQASGNELVDTAKTTTATWSTTAPAAANYTINVYADPSTMQPGQNVQYALQVGQYGGGTAQPATGSTAAPVAPGATPPASTAAPAPAGSAGG